MKIEKLLELVDDELIGGAVCIDDDLEGVEAQLEEQLRVVKVVRGKIKRKMDRWEKILEREKERYIE